MNIILYRVIAILIMCIVTYIPRALPITFFTKTIKSRFIKDFLYYVPYAVLTALTIPSIFYCVDNIVVAITATITAIILSLFNQKLIVVALVSVLVVFGLGLIL